MHCIVNFGGNNFAFPETPMGCSLISRDKTEAKPCGNQACQIRSFQVGRQWALGDGGSCVPFTFSLSPNLQPSIIENGQQQASYVSRTTFIDDVLTATTGGIQAARKLRTSRRENRWADKDYNKRALGKFYKTSPTGGSSHAKGIVLEKVRTTGML